MHYQTLPYEILYVIRQYLPNTCIYESKFRQISKAYRDKFKPCVFKHIKFIDNNYLAGCPIHTPIKFEIINELKKLGTYHHTVHFSSAEVCKQAKPYVKRIGFVIHHSCCMGKGLITNISKFRKTKWMNYQLKLSKR